MEIPLHTLCVFLPNIPNTKLLYTSKKSTLSLPEKTLITVSALLRLEIVYQEPTKLQAISFQEYPDPFL